MLEAVTTDLVFTISLKRSTQNLQLSTSWVGRLPHLSAGKAGVPAAQPHRAEFGTGRTNRAGLAMSVPWKWHFGAVRTVVDPKRALQFGILRPRSSSEGQSDKVRVRISEQAAQW